MQKRVIYILLLLSVFITSCISRPDYVLDEDKMTDVLVEVHRSEGLIEMQQTKNPNNDEYQKAVMAAVLVKQGVTRAQYDSSLVWYGQNLSYLIKVYNRVQKRIGEEIDYWTEIDNHSRNEFAVSEAGDTVDVWTINRHYVFDEKRLVSFRFWEIPSDSNYVAGDSLVWHLRVPYLPKAHFLVASLSLNYHDNDSVFAAPISKTVVLRNDTSLNITCASDPKTKIFKSMIASISVMKDSTNVPDSWVYVDSLSMFRIHRP